jgi:hypothetical protein
MSNPFETWAEAEKPKWQERLETRARLRQKKLAAVMAEKRELELRYQAVKQEERERLVAGPYGDELEALILFLETLGPDSGAELVRTVQGLPWLKAAHADLRFEALHLISGAIISLRESQGLPPFDDPIFDGRPSVFLKLREMLT